MSTPAMLRTPNHPPPPGVRSNPAVGAGAARLVVALLVVVTAGLLGAGTLAVYDWTTPAIEGSVVVTIAVVFGVAMLTLVLTSALRAARRNL